MTEVSEILAQAGYRRGGRPVYEAPDWPRTAVLICNMQRAWTASDGPFRALLPGQDAQFFRDIDHFAAQARQRGARIVWLRTTTAPTGQPGYWTTYFDNFVGSDKRGAAAEALTAGSTFHALDPAMGVAAQDWIIDKPRFDAFIGTDLDTRLRAASIQDVITCGTATNICCEGTTRSAMAHDFRTWMPHDLVSAPTPDGHAAGLRNVAQSFAEISASGELIG